MSWSQPSIMQSAQNQQIAEPSDGPSEAEIAALKRLSSFVIADDDDAGNVIDVINSLTQTYLQYKTRTLSAPVRELLVKSLKNGNEGLECILKHHGVENMKPLEKFSDINNPTTRCASNVLRQFSSKWKEDSENVPSKTKSDHSFDEVSYSNRGRDVTMQENEMTSMASPRNERDYPLGQSSRGWNDAPLRSGASGNFGNTSREPFRRPGGGTVPSNFYRSNNNASLQNKEDAPSIVDLFKTYRSRSKF